MIFGDGPAGAVAISADIFPSNVSFTNTVATSHTFSGGGGISGTTALSKTGVTALSFSPRKTVTWVRRPSAPGTLELDHDATGNQVLTGTSGVSVASGATLRITRDGTATAAATTFSRDISGTGNVDVNLRTGAVGAVADSLLLTGTNTGFTGTLRLLSPATGTYRLQTPTPAQLGNGSIEVQSGAQLYLAAQTYNNSITIAGTGFADSAGNIGAMRFEPSAVWAGPIVVNGSARIGVHSNVIGTAGVVSGSISGGDLTVNATNFNNSYNLIFTGSNSYGATIIGGQNIQTAAVPSMRLNIGNGGTTGTLGTGNVTIHGDGANGVLGFDRSDGYTLGAGQTITGGVGAGTIANSISAPSSTSIRSAPDSAITQHHLLGTAALGGNICIAQSRAARSPYLRRVTAQTLRVGSNRRWDPELISGATVRSGPSRSHLSEPTLQRPRSTSLPGRLSHEHLLHGRRVRATGIVNQTGGSVSVTQLRIGRFPNNTSNYTISAGTLTVNGTPSQFPFKLLSPKNKRWHLRGRRWHGQLTHSGGTVSTGFSCSITAPTPVGRTC